MQKKQTTYRLFKGEEFIGFTYAVDTAEAYQYWAQRSRETGHEYTLRKWN